MATSVSAESLLNLIPDELLEKFAAETEVDLDVYLFTPYAKVKTLFRLVEATHL